MSSKKKENELRKAALEGDVTTLSSLIASGVNMEAQHPKVCAPPGPLGMYVACVAHG